MAEEFPNGLVAAIEHFSNPQVCVDTVAAAKWPNGPECPRCQAKRVSYVTTRYTWTCLECRKQFSVKVGTIFEDSPIALNKWLCAMWMVGNCKNGVSSYEIARDLEVTQKTAWFMLHRIRYAMHHGTFDKMSGTVEADETFIGGKARNMHAGRREKMIKGRVHAVHPECIDTPVRSERATRTPKYDAGTNLNSPAKIPVSARANLN